MTGAWSMVWRVRRRRSRWSCLVLRGLNIFSRKTSFGCMRTRPLLLTLVASLCDASTFVGAGRLFSAHVTGNFIVLAYDLVRGTDRHEWSKLLAFPMFFVAVMIAAKVDKLSNWARGDYRLLGV